MATERQYLFAIMRDEEVVVSTPEGRPEWRLRLPRGAWGWSRAPQNDALLIDNREGPFCTVRRLRRFPRPRYVLLAGEEQLGTIDGLNVWRTRYRMNFTQGRSCEFHLPMFTARFTVTSENSVVAHVRMLREHVWAVLFQPGEDRPELIAALARLLCARWRSE